MSYNDIDYCHNFGNVDQLAPGLRLTTSGFVKREREDSCISFTSGYSTESPFDYSPSTPQSSPISPKFTTISPDMLFDNSYCSNALSGFSFGTHTSPSHIPSMPFMCSIEDMSGDEHLSQEHTFDCTLADTCSPVMDFSSQRDFFPFGSESFYNSSFEERPSSSEGSLCEQSLSDCSKSIDIEHISRDRFITKIRKSSIKTGKELPFVISSADKHHKCHLPAMDGGPCDRSFKRQEHLRRHLRTHTNLKPFLCPVGKCKAFSRRDNLKAHWITHSKKNGRNKYIENCPENPEDYPEFLKLHPEIEDDD